jgi:ferredoxin
MYEFEFRTGKVSVDYGKWGKPVLSVSPEEARRLCIECLACEQECYFKGQQALTIVLPPVLRYGPSPG